ncbi:autotransporter outer membrane beta-barrel domain-containing protein [Candidatus Pelagibacter sp.]|nr:autotransporter outer membrane beta-barrel domain-containing protein [Candidatus Pelagibacter sp.]
MVFFLRKLAVGLLVSSFFILMQAQAEYVTPTYVQSATAINVSNAQTVGVELSPDGTKVFFARYGHADGKRLYQYTLSTPFDISTIDTSTEVILDLNAGSDDLTAAKVEDLAFNGDGTKVYAISLDGKMNVHTLSAPYDFSSFTQDTDDGISWNTYLTPGDGNIRIHDIRFNDDGTKMYLNEAMPSDNPVAIVEYHLATPYLPGSTTKTQEFDIDPQISQAVQSFNFDDDGTRMYVIESSTSDANHNLVVYKLSTGFDVTTATHAGTISNFFNAAGGGGTPGGMHFSNDGMKFYQVTWGGSTINKIHEYDLTCPYGIVLCESETASVASAQVEIAKNVIHQNTSTIFKRFEWLRRNENKTNLNSHNLKLNINNPILASLKNELQSSFKSSFKDVKYTQASLKTEKPSENKRKWSHWSNADISFGRVGDKASIKPKEITTKGISFGADKLTKNDNFFGFAVRYGNDDIDIKSATNEELNSQSLSFNVYSQLPVNEKSNLNALLGVSFLSIDQMISGTITGERYGKQIYTALSYEEEQNYTKFDIIPYGKAELGITQLSEYTDFGTSSTNNIETHERLTFKTGNASAGFKFDQTLYWDENKLSGNGHYEENKLNRNGFLEYVVDFTPDIDHRYKNHIDSVTVQNTIKRYSLNNIKGNIGFELFKKSGHTFALNYERFQSLDNSAHTDSLLFKFGKQKNKNTNLNVIYDPLKNNNTEISYLKNYDNFNLKVKSNYAMYSKIPDYGAGIELSATF